MLGRVAIIFHLGASWGHLGAILGPSWAILRLSWAILEPSWGHLGPSWGHLGALLGRLGPLLETSWGHLRRLKTQKDEVAKTYKNHWFLQGLGALRPSKLGQVEVKLAS